MALRSWQPKHIDIAIYMIVDNKDPINLQEFQAKCQGQSPNEWRVQRYKYYKNIHGGQEGKSNKGGESSDWWGEYKFDENACRYACYSIKQQDSVLEKAKHVLMNSILHYIEQWRTTQIQEQRYMIKGCQGVMNRKAWKCKSSGFHAKKPEEQQLAWKVTHISSKRNNI